MSVELALSDSSKKFLKGSNCAHKAILAKDSFLFIGIWNGLTHSAHIEDGKGKTVEYLSTEQEVDEDPNEGIWYPNFSENDFVVNGYEILSYQEIEESKISVY